MKKKIIIPLTIFFIAIFTALFYRFYIYYPDITLKVTALYDEHPNVVECKNEYFILSDGKITNADSKEVIYSVADENSFIKSYNDLIWIFDGSSNEKLKAIDKNGNVKKRYLFPEDSIDFMINGDVIFDLTSDELIIYRLKDETHLKKVKIDYTFVFHSDENRFDLYKYSCEYGECLFFDMTDENDIDIYFATDKNYNEIIGSKKSGSNCIDLYSFGKDSIIYAYYLNYNNLFEYSFKDNNSKGSILELTDHVKNFYQRRLPYYSNQNLMILITQENKYRSLRREPPVSFSDEMEKHDHDYAVIIDKNDFEVKEKKTKTFERILYVDSEKAITYYKGKYLTYSLDGWKVTDKQSASEIKEGGSYNFVTCGDYIFVFDNDSDELLNKISISDT